MDEAIGKRPVVEGIDLQEEPPKGERLIDEGSLAQAREERLQSTWASKLKEELELCDALDPDRAALALAGKTRASTLKRYVTIYGRWRLWLKQAKEGNPPASSRPRGLYPGEGRRALALPMGG